MDKWMDSYQARVNDERLARQAQTVQDSARSILDALKTIETYVYWAFDPDEKEGGMYNCRNLLEHAHELVDQAHEFRARVRANPPPKETEDDDEAAA